MYLNCKTYYSFRYGVFKTEELVKEAVQSGAQFLTLTNINCTADHWEFLKLCNEYHIQPILGLEVRNAVILQYLIIAKNSSGVKEINGFLSQHLQNELPFPDKCPLKEN